MPSDSTLVLTINPLTPQAGEYRVQLIHEGKPIAEAPAHIDLQRLLELEHQYSTHDYGMALYDALFTGKVSREYQRLVGKAGSEDTVRIQLVISEHASELHTLAWERLFHLFGDEESPLATSAQTPFSRFLISGQSDQAAVSADPLRILFVIAHPSNLDERLAAIQVIDEVNALATMVAQSPRQLHCTLLTGRTDLPDELRQQLLAAGWTIAPGVSSWQNIQRNLHNQQILHILAHGQLATDDENPAESRAYLLLEHEGDEKNTRGALDRVDDKTICEKLSGVHPLPQLIFLAACESAKRPQAVETDRTGEEQRRSLTTNPFVGLAPKLVIAGVPAVVAMQDKIEVGMAHSLTLDFYCRLFEHGQVDRALNEARALLYERNSFEWAIPVLFLRLQDGRLFSTVPIVKRLAFEPEMIFVRGGSFLMGSHSSDGIPNYETPQHSVDLGDYYVSKNTITNQEYAEFTKQVKTQDVPNQAGWFNRKPPTGRLTHPVTGVNWYDAVAYCVWLSKKTQKHYQLPSEAEWEKAARGTSGQRYPWGENWDKRNANFNGQGTAVVASHPGGVSSFGCEDMLGNVEEWTRTLWGNQWSTPESCYPYDENDGRNVTTADDIPPQGKVVHRGGSYQSSPDQLYCARRDCADPSSKVVWRGFRVVMKG